MSKAFTDEEAAPAPPIVRPRAPLPDGVPNYVTERGLALLRAELASLDAELLGPGGDFASAERAALAERRAALEARIASAEVVSQPTDDPQTVRFGATVTVDGDAGVRSYQIVGVDEADASQRRVSFVSPIARALLGRAIGDTVRFRTPRGEEILAIVAVEYRPEPP